MTIVRQMVKWFQHVLGPEEFWLGVGLLLLGAGFWMLNPACGLIVPGAVLCWITLPLRRPFLQKHPVAAEAKRSKA